MFEVQLKNVSFHEATVVRLIERSGKILIDLDDAYLDGRRAPAMVTISGADNIIRNGEMVNIINMEKGDGEVLSLREESNFVLLVVKWNDFSSKQSETVTYKILGAKIDSVRPN